MPSTHSNVFEIDSLMRVEALCRRRLEREPDDMAARISLAWCLFLRSFHRAGQESVLRELAFTDRDERDLLLARIRGVPDHGAAQLVQDCLKNTFTVMQLSGDPDDVASVERLQALARLSGANEAIVHAEEEAIQVIEGLVRDIIGGPDANQINTSNGSNGSNATSAG